MKNREEMILEIMHFMSDKFKDRIVLWGGMLLRLLNSQRSTQDIDYVLVSDESKKILAKRVEEFLGEMNGIKILNTELNSRGIFIEVESRETPGIRAMLEINVLPSLNIPPDHISTVALSNRYSVVGRVISTMALSEAFANKIIAAIERDSLRDLYDISIYEPLCVFDTKTLLDNLGRLSVNRNKPKAVSPRDAAEMLAAKADRLTAANIERELEPLISLDQLKGIEMIIKASVLRVVEKMKIISEEGV